VSNEPAKKAKSTWKNVKRVLLILFIAFIAFIIWQNWEPRPLRIGNLEPRLPQSIWLALFFLAGVAVGGLLFLRRRK
jgi:choline-glycine betaine transporter